MIHGKHEAFGICVDNILVAARKLDEWKGLDTKLTTEEAFVKVPQRHGTEHVFGIIGAAFMPRSDLFPVVRCPSSTPRKQ